MTPVRWAPTGQRAIIFRILISIGLGQWCKKKAEREQPSPLPLGTAHANLGCCSCR
jgi:hypothetical protein